MEKNKIYNCFYINNTNFYDAYKFLNTKGSDHPIAGTLFDMIIILAVLVFLYHKDDIAEGNKDILGQTYLEKYFKKEKKD